MRTGPWKVIASLNVPGRSACSLALFAFVSMSGTPVARAAEPAPASTPLLNPQLSRLTPAPRLTPPVLHALGLMTAMRATEAYLWPQPFAETDRIQLGLHYHAAFSQAPRWDGSRPLFEADGDRWQINVLGHGLFGSELYLRARTCRFPAWQALLFTGVASATWEYGFEANGVRPSALDLTFTPAAGLVLGEARFQGWQAARRLDPGPLRTTLSALLDPLGDLERVLGSPC
jgi:hypothetical protein